MPPSKKSSREAVDITKCQPGAYFILPHGSKRWRLAELRIDHLWYPAGEPDGYATIAKWQPILVPELVPYTPEVPL